MYLDKWVNYLQDIIGGMKDMGWLKLSLAYGIFEYKLQYNDKLLVHQETMELLVI